MHFPTEEDCRLGPIISELRGAKSIGTLNGLSVRLVDSSVPQPDRYKIAHVAMVAQRSMSDYPTGYDGTITEDDQQLYVLAEGERAVAFVLTAFDRRFWRLAWRANGSIELLDRKALLHRGRKVGRVWVASEQRRRGLSARLVKVAAEHLSVEVPELGWELPLSPPGAALVRHFLPTTFYGCGDLQSLRNAIDGGGSH